MTPFLIFILILLIGTSVFNKSILKKDIKKKMLIFAWIVITIFCGSNDALNFGSDISAYFQHAQRALNLSLDDYMHLNPFEPGFCVYLWGVVHLFKDPQVFLFVQYGFVNAVVLYFIYKYADNPFYGIIGYVCLGGFSFYFTAIRQAMAMAICMIGLMQMLQGHWIRAILWVLIATTFHMTSIVFIPALFIKKLKIKRNNTVLIIICCILLSFFMRPLVNIGNEYMGESYGALEHKFKSYTGAIISIITMLVSLLLYIKNRRVGVIESNDNIFFYVTMIALTFYLMRFEVLAMERVSFYFMPIVGVGLANSICRYRHLTHNPSITAWFVILASVLFLVRSSNTFGSSYRMIW